MKAMVRFVVLAWLTGAVFGQTPKMGHSHRGEAFDEGPRQRPVRMQGVGRSPFPITGVSAEVQQWFDQGIALLHSFWFHEAERTFRWTVKLDPECAMCWWGLSRSTEDVERGKAFLREASKRKHKLTRRERLYIEAWELAPGYDFFRGDRDDKFRYALEKLLIEFPDDIEAKALYGLTNLGGPTRLANDRILREVLAKAPDHPGAHHYRIHNWNYRDAEQALDSSEAYGRVVPGIGHAQHMPGHIYSTAGMWNEAALSMDAATRVEAAYMRDRLVMPFSDWNYGHNRNYLNYILEQLGMANAAIAGGKELLTTPRDPKYSRTENWYSTHRQGMWSLARTLVKFERWKELLDPKTIPWGSTAFEQTWKHYVTARAHLGLGNLAEAEKAIRAHSEVKTEESNRRRVDTSGDNYLKTVHSIMAAELKGLLLLARGETLEGLTALGDAAKRQYDEQLHDNDPPSYPNVIYLGLGRAYLKTGSPKLAVEAFEKALELVRNDGFALAGLVDAYAAAGMPEKVNLAKARLQFVWADADQRPQFEAKPVDESPRPQRNYLRTSLEKFGPPHWEPFRAPDLSVVDAGGAKVTLKDYRGKNVIVVFYLGDECPHCLQQLEGLRQRRDELGRLNTQVIAISRSPAKATSEGVRLLSDADLSNAKRFQSYDDFEEIELHSTFLIDRFGRVAWARVGGDPFTDYAFLISELERINGLDAPSEAP
jgi:peroxiredoxin/tetratricopeptide (TPR) repeat protein